MNDDELLRQLLEELAELKQRVSELEQSQKVTTDNADVLKIVVRQNAYDLACIRGAELLKSRRAEQQSPDPE